MPGVSVKFNAPLSLQNNVIGNSVSGYYSSYGVIVGGSSNCIDSGSGAVAHNSCYGFIGGGKSNLICQNTCYSSILGGTGNTNSASYSTIIGGIGNTIPSTMPHSAIFGNGISAVSPDTFHVSCLNAVNTPVTPDSGWPSGTIFRYCNSFPLPLGALPLYIKP